METHVYLKVEVSPFNEMKEKLGCTSQLGLPSIGGLPRQGHGDSGHSALWGRGQIQCWLH